MRSAISQDRLKSKLHSPSFKDAWITLSSPFMLKYTLSSPLIQNILESISLPSYVKIYALVPQ